MQTMHPVIVFGSYLLDGENIPPDEYEVRMMAAQAMIESNGWAGLVVYGDPVESAFLTYVTNYVPRNRLTLALVPAEGPPRMLIGASPRDIKRETAMACVEDARMIGKLNVSLDAWIDDAGIRHGAIGVVGSAEMPIRTYDAIAGACTARGLSVVDADAAAQALLHRKRPREMVVVRRAAAVLGAAVDAMSDAWKSGATATDCSLAAENAAYANEALDARTLFSLDNGRSLRPFARPLPDRPDRLAAYVAVRYQAYWAEGFVTLSKRKTAVQKAAAGALESMIAASRPGATGRDLSAAAAIPLKFAPHTAIGGGLGHGIGLSLDEPPALRADSSAAMEQDGVYSLTVGLSEGRRNHALSSAMVALEDGRAEVLWRAP